MRLLKDALLVLISIVLSAVVAEAVRQARHAGFVNCRVGCNNAVKAEMGKPLGYGVNLLVIQIGGNFQGHGFVKAMLISQCFLFFLQ